MSEAQAGNGKPQGPEEQSPEAASPLLDHISELAAAFLNGSSWEEAKNQFRLLYKPIFQGIKKDEGYTLLHHRAFVDFQRLFESTLKQRLDMLGVTEEQFLQQLESGTAPEDEAIRVIFDTVELCEDFEKFAKWMRQNPPSPVINVLVYWDIENLGPPLDAVYPLVLEATAALKELSPIRKHGAKARIKWHVFHYPLGARGLPRGVCKDLVRAGVRIFDIGISKPEAADRMIERELRDVEAGVYSRDAVVVLLTRDTDFLDSIRALQDSGFVVVVPSDIASPSSPRRASAKCLSEQADVVIDWDDLVEQVTKEAPPASASGNGAPQTTVERKQSKKSKKKGKKGQQEAKAAEQGSKVVEKLFPKGSNSSSQLEPRAQKMERCAGVVETWFTASKRDRNGRRGYGWIEISSESSLPKGTRIFVHNTAVRMKEESMFRELIEGETVSFVLKTENKNGKLDYIAMDVRDPKGESLLPERQRQQVTQGEKG